MDTPIKRTFTATAQVIWQLETTALGTDIVVTTETLRLETTPTKGAFMDALNKAIKIGRETPAPKGYSAEPLRVYGPLHWEQLTGPVLDQDGEVPEQDYETE